MFRANHLGNVDFSAFMPSPPEREVNLDIAILIDRIGGASGFVRSQ